MEGFSYLQRVGSSVATTSFWYPIQALLSWSATRNDVNVEASLSSMLCSRWLWRGGRSSSSPNSGLPSRSFLRPVRLSSTGTFVSQGGMAFSEGAFDLATGAAIALLSLLEARQ